MVKRFKRPLNTSKFHESSAFSMVEVVLALGVMAFAMMTLLALLPLGVKNNRISAEETRAVALLAGLDSDLRNSRLPAGSPQPLLSHLFGLQTPYELSVSGKHLFNPSLQENTLYSIYLDEAEIPRSSPASARYQASVVYVRIPPASSRQPLQARLIVNWPALDLTAFSTETDKIAALTDPSRVTGHVENIITFPAP